jgi:alpha-tubulin suppressor-like RCC1 family protein
VVFICCNIFIALSLESEEKEDEEGAAAPEAAEKSRALAIDFIANKFRAHSKPGSPFFTMVVLRKRKYAKPPEKFHFEQRVKDYDEYVIRGYGPPVSTENNQELSTHPQIYAAAWGWNSNGRAGNITSDEIREPRFTQHSAGPRYIACAAGKHHSLLVSDDGSVYSFGDGRKGQLGYGNPFFDKPPKGGILQVFPRIVNPSGACKHGRDVKVVEVACGESFSIAREGSLEDGVDLCPGLRSLERALIQLKALFADCPDIQFAWAQARQERFILSTFFEGKLLSWGTGKYGELGQGKYRPFSPYPQVIPKLEFVTIVKISAGANHVLAVSKDGQLFSWGKGKSGRLGHGNNHDQAYPKVVQYLLLYQVNTCAAGDAHSAVLITRRKANSKGVYMKAVATFGRGAHGRLGLGHNRSISLPDVVKVFPPSFTHPHLQQHHGTVKQRENDEEEYSILQIACGGAHTLLLASRVVRKSLANPFGIETYVASWGFGSNGQLGLGSTDLRDHFTPVRVKMPKWEIICEVSAGRSWSLARTLSGELYSWGKGLRGQLGQGKPDFSLAPRKVDTFASFLSISSQYSHNVAITTTKRVLSSKNYESLIDDISSSQTTPGEDPLDFLTAPKKRLHLRLADHNGLAMSSFDCCRRNIRNWRQSRVRVECVTCHLAEVCLLCARFCHRNHELIESISPSSSSPLDEKIPFCKCGVFHAKCRLLPSISECVFELEFPPLQPVPVVPLEVLKKTKSKLALKKSLSSVREAPELVQSVKKEALPPDPGDLPRVQTEQILKAVRSIQTLARSFIGRAQLKRMMTYVRFVRRTACERWWDDTLAAAIWKKYQRCSDEYRREKELEDMAYEDQARRLYDFYHNLQAALIGMDTMLDGIRKLLMQTSCLLPTQEETMSLREREELVTGGGGEGVEGKRRRRRITTEELFEICRTPSLIFSVHTLRMIERMKHHSERIPLPLIAKLGRFFPHYDPRQGEFYDSDINQLTGRYVRTPEKEKEVRRILDTCERVITGIKEEAAKKAKKKEKTGPTAEVSGVSISVPPPGPPAPPALPLAQKKPPPPAPPGKPGVPPPSQVRPGDRSKKKGPTKAEPETPTTVHEALRQRDSALIKLERRKSVAGPERLSSRIQKMRFQTKKRSVLLRRNSLPDRLHRLYGEERPQWSYHSEVAKSLDLFATRQIVMEEFLLKDYAFVWKKTPVAVKKHKMHQALKASWLTPRLPVEMRGLVLGQGAPERRHSIGEMERFGQHVTTMLKTRTQLLQLRAKATKAKIPVRRRSYDFGELMDAEEGLNSLLGFDFEEKRKVPTVFELKSDYLKMERLLLETNFVAVDINRFMKHAIAGTDSAGEGGEVEVWMEYYDGAGVAYYYNTTTGESVWEAPVGWNIHLWSQFQDPGTGAWCWYNSATGEVAPM